MADTDDIYNLLDKSLPGIKRDVEELKLIAQSNERALRGADGEPGLVSRVKELCGDQEEVKKMVSNHETLLYKGKSDTEPGLIEQVREGKKFRASWNRFYWLLIGAVTVGLINIAITLIRLAFTPATGAP